MKQHIFAFSLLLTAVTLLNAQHTGQVFVEEPVQIFSGGQGFGRVQGKCRSA
jgi:hypothetical protein